MARSGHREWAETLAHAANANTGLVVTDDKIVPDEIRP